MTAGVDVGVPLRVRLRMMRPTSGRTRRITGLPPGGEGVSLVPVGTGAIVASFRACCAGPVMHYVVRKGAMVATPLAPALMAIASRDGHGAWLLTSRRPHGCILREIDLAGRDRRPPVIASCTMGLVADVPGGLLVDYSDPGGANSRLLYPPVGGNINGGSTNASISIPAGKSATCESNGLIWVVNVSA